MTFEDLLTRDNEEIISMLSDHGVKVEMDAQTGGYLVVSEGMGELIAERSTKRVGEFELCLILWGVIAGKKRAASIA